VYTDCGLVAMEVKAEDSDPDDILEWLFTHYAHLQQRM